MALAGHKTRSVFARYNITSEADLRDAAEKLDAIDRDSIVTVTGQAGPCRGTIARFTQ